MKYILSLIVENKHGVLAKVSQVITGRGYNIQSLSVGPSEHSDTSRMIIVFDCDERIVEQVMKQMNKLIDVIKISLIRIMRKKENDEAIIRTIKIFRGKIVDMTPKSFVVEVTGNVRKIDAFIENIRPYGIQELMRTGPLALPRG